MTYFLRKRSTTTLVFVAVPFSWGLEKSKPAPLRIVPQHGVPSSIHDPKRRISPLWTSLFEEVKSPLCVPQTAMMYVLPSVRTSSKSPPVSVSTCIHWTVCPWITEVRVMRLSGIACSGKEVFMVRLLCSRYLDARQSFSLNNRCVLVVFQIASMLTNCLGWSMPQISDIVRSSSGISPLGIWNG